MASEQGRIEFVPGAQIERAIRETRGLSHTFRDWAGQAHMEGVLLQYLQIVMDGRSDIGFALQKLDAIVRRSDTETSLTSGDLKVGTRKRRSAVNGSNGDPDEHRWRLIGTRVHEAVLGVLDLEEESRQGELILWPERVEEEDVDAEAEEDTRLFSVVRRVPENILERVEEIRGELDAPLRDHNAWVEKYPKSIGLMFELGDLLSQEVGEWISGLSLGEDLIGRYLRAVIYSTCAGFPTSATLQGLKGSLVFTEIPVAGFEFGAGRHPADIFQVLLEREPVRGKNREECLKALRGLKEYSIDAILHRLRKSLGRQVSGRILDLKVAVGDNLPSEGSKGKVIKRSDVIKEPLAIHARQMKRYLAVSTLACHWRARGIASPEKAFSSSPMIGGEIIYLLQDGEMIHHITMEEAEVYMREVFAPRVSRARQWARMRRVQHTLDRLVRNGGIQRAWEESRPEQMRIDIPHAEGWRKSSALPVALLTEHFREFIDPKTRIVELGPMVRGKRVLRMQIGALREAMLNSRIAINKGFNWRTGGSIQCMNPNHTGHEGGGERTPSLHIYLKDGHFHCYGCGEMHGVIAEESIPPELSDIRDVVRSNWAERGTKASSKSIKDVAIPEELGVLMGDAQTILRRGFRKSRGGDYLREVRRLDPELAWNLGAGLWTDEVIFGLLKRGHEFEELEQFGVITRSMTVQPDNPFIRRLQKELGLTLKELGKEGEDKEGNTRLLLPRNPLWSRNGYITFPLTLGGLRTGFYGREIGQKKTRFAHMKLRTGFPNGAFGEGRLNDDKVKEVIVCEGVMDALTIMEALPGKIAIAIIGTNNNIVIDAIGIAGRAGKKIFVALDFDEPGRKATKKIIKTLKEAECEAEDFTPAFLDTFPDARDHDDYNTWWTEVGWKQRT